ncbi:MAG: 4Fe-4S dicluster domain-containing protein, partial [Myxococcota bacterium]
MSASESTKPGAYGVFDARHPPSADGVADCVHCGFCLPTCPTYVLWGRETDSPRGRIHLIKMALDGEVPLDDSFRQHFDNCLGCMGCLSSCPSGVEYDALLEATRPQLERRSPASAPDRRFRRFIL